MGLGSLATFLNAFRPRLSLIRAGLFSGFDEALEITVTLHPIRLWTLDAVLYAAASSEWEQPVRPSVSV